MGLLRLVLPAWRTRRPLALARERPGHKPFSARETGASAPQAAGRRGPRRWLSRSPRIWPRGACDLAPGGPRCGIHGRSVGRAVISNPATAGTASRWGCWHWPSSSLPRPGSTPRDRWSLDRHRPADLRRRSRRPATLLIAAAAVILMRTEPHPEVRPRLVLGTLMIAPAGTSVCGICGRDSAR